MADELFELALVEQAIAGDRTALSQLLLACYDDLQRSVTHQLSVTGHANLSAEDILQQTFVRAALGVRHFEPRTTGSFQGWLRTIAGNLIRDAQKRRRRERRATDLFPRQSIDAGESADFPRASVEQLAGDSTSPSMRVHRRDSLQQIRTAMDALPPEQREVIQRHYLQNQSFDQIAGDMHRTKDAIRGISNRARHNLRALLGHSSRFFSK